MQRRAWVWSGSWSAVLLAGCAAVPPRPADVAMDRELALPPAVAAAVVGGALRLALPFCDPVPASRGVLVQCLGPDHWRLAFAPHTGGWTPCASHRLALLPAADAERAPQVVVQALPAGQCTDRVPPADGFALEVLAATAGARLVGRAPQPLVAAVDRALALALAPHAALPGREETNLATWAEHRLLVTARTAADRGERARAHALRQAATRLRGTNAQVQAQLADDAERRGDLAPATDHRWQALLLTRDPRQRSAWAERLGGLANRGEDPVAWRRAARAHLHAVDPDEAADLLHTARRLHDEPSLDYRLHSQLHRLRHDDDAAQANALLAREHAGIDVDMPTFVAELWVDAVPPAAPAIAWRLAAPLH